MKNNVTAFSVATMMALSCVSCQDDTDELSGRYATQDISTTKQLATTKQYQVYSDTESFVKSGMLTEQEALQIKEALNSVDDPSVYTLEIYRDGKLADRTGSAALGDLQTSGVYYSDRFSEILLSEMICPELFPNIFRAIWTGFGRTPFSDKYQEQIATVEKIINYSATNAIDLQTVALGEEGLHSMQKVLASVDPAAYRVEVYQDGKVANSLGSAALSDLRQSGAYYSDASGGLLLDYDICPPLRNIIKGIWVGPWVQDKFGEQVGQVEEIINQAGIH